MSRFLLGGMRRLAMTPSVNSTLIRSQSTVANIPMVELEVDGKKVSVEAGTVLIRACEAAGVEIPRFCYHERLAIAGNCRMCLVELEKSPKPIASCAMPVAPGMKIKTNSPLVKKAREGVMEFLLANHPLDCPICDQGGECDLQDQSVVYGSDRSRYLEVDVEGDGFGKRAVEDKNFGPLVKTVMTRCIHCTRCVRFANEVAGAEQLGTSGRGNNMEIGTYIEKMLDNEMSGNIIDLCPVGALTSKPYAFTSRPWELRRIESIDVLDALGSNIRVDARGQEVMRILPRINETVNEEWLGDKSRFAYDGLKRQRLLTPLVREGDKFHPRSWEEAFSVVGEIMSRTPGNRIKGVVGQLVDAESIIALKDLLNRLGSSHLSFESDHSFPAHGADIRSNYLFNSKIKGIEECDCLLLIGTNPKHEAPVLNSRIRKAYLHNYINIGLIGHPAPLTVEYTHLGSSSNSLGDLISGRNTFKFAEQFKTAKRPLVIIGSEAVQREDGGYLMNAISQLTKVNPNLVSEKWNGISTLQRAAARSAALDLGIVPGVNAQNTKPAFVYLLGADDFNPKEIPKDAFVVYQGHHGDVGASYADVILPGSAYTEKQGTYVNTEGRVQFTRPAVNPPGNAREDWKIITALSHSLGLNLPYHTLSQVRERLGEVAPHLTGTSAHEDDIEPTSYQIATLGLAQLQARYGNAPSSSAKFTPTIKDYYLTDPISRASQTMAKCSAAFTQNTSVNKPSVAHA